MSTLAEAQMCCARLEFAGRAGVERPRFRESLKMWTSDYVQRTWLHSLLTATVADDPEARPSGRGSRALRRAGEAGLAGVVAVGTGQLGPVPGEALPAECARKSGHRTRARDDGYRDHLFPAAGRPAEIGELTELDEELCLRPHAHQVPAAGGQPLRQLVPLHPPPWTGTRTPPRSSPEGLTGRCWPTTRTRRSPSSPSLPSSAGWVARQRDGSPLLKANRIPR